MCTPPNYFDLLENPHIEQPHSDVEPPPLTEYARDCLYPNYADLSYNPHDIEPGCVSEPAPLDEVDEDYLRYEGFIELSGEEAGSEPEPPMDYTDMSGPEEDPDEYVEEGQEPKPSWLDSSGESSEGSDVDSEKPDMFHVSISTRKPFTTESDRDMENIRALARLIRERPLLPPDPEDPTKDFTDLNTGIEFPLYHCVFIGCAHVPKMGESLYRHIQMAHDSFYTICGRSDPSRAGPWDWIKAYYIGAVREKEEKRIPVHGVSIDRRTMGTASSEYNSKKIKSLVCLCCAQVHTSWDGDEVIERFDEHRRSEICYYRAKSFFNQISTGDSKAIETTLSWIHFHARYMTDGSSLDKDPLLKADSWERREVFLAEDGDETKIICCPKDVLRCDQMVHAAHEICGKCAVPLCHVCHASFLREWNIPMVLCNNNYIGYVSKTLVEYKVRFI